MQTYVYHELSNKYLGSTLCLLLSRCCTSVSSTLVFSGLNVMLLSRRV